MRAELHMRYRLLLRAERRFDAADRHWHAAAHAARALFPAPLRPSVLPIGDPGSPVRQLWERRERELLALLAARARLEGARARLATPQRHGDRLTLIAAS